MLHVYVCVYIHVCTEIRWNVQLELCLQNCVHIHMNVHVHTFSSGLHVHYIYLEMEIANRPLTLHVPPKKHLTCTWT